MGDSYDFRSIMADILTFTGGKRVLSVSDIQAYTGISSWQTVHKRFPILDGYLSAPALARCLCGKIPRTGPFRRSTPPDYEIVLADILNFSNGVHLLSLETVKRYTGFRSSNAIKRRYPVVDGYVAAPALANALCGRNSPDPSLNPYTRTYYY